MPRFLLKDYYDLLLLFYWRHRTMRDNFISVQLCLQIIGTIPFNDALMQVIEIHFECDVTNLLCAGIHGVVNVYDGIDDMA